MPRGRTRIILLITLALLGCESAMEPESGPGGALDAFETHAGDAGDAGAIQAGGDTAVSDPDSADDAVLPDGGGAETGADTKLDQADADLACPTAVITVDEGEEVAPGTTIHLHAGLSSSPNGAIVAWQWEVDQPAGSEELFSPTASHPDPTFDIKVAGSYTFRLHVVDEAGVTSCEPAVAEVITGCTEAIHVELLWSTPGDPDPTATGPQAGADLDLHVAHPLAIGQDVDGDGAPEPWFEIPHDCFWFNEHPNWATPALTDDPSLDRDDTSGNGPENFSLDQPEDLTYRVAVHYWDDHGHGTSLATLRIYLYGQLTFELTQELEQDQLWEVATIDWPAGQAQTISENGAPKIFNDYPNPLITR
jgi:hypothetical protein